MVSRDRDGRRDRVVGGLEILRDQVDLNRGRGGGAYLSSHCGNDNSSNCKERKYTAGRHAG